MKKKLFIIICSLLLPMTTKLSAQTMRIVDADTFWTWVKERHPDTKRMLLLRDQARQLYMEAQGAFDPKMYAFQEQKTFGGTDYFRFGGGGLKWATPFGAEIKAEYNWADGIYLNGERNLPDAGQAVLGVRMPLGEGLFIDERRTNLWIARTAERMNEARAAILGNELFLDCQKTYWEWSWSYHALQVIDEALQVSREQFEVIKESYLQGKLPAIDTLESFLQLQQWTLEREQAALTLAAAEAQLAVFLWGDTGQPMPLPDDWQPESPTAPLDSVDIRLIRDQLDQHPELQQYAVKLEQLTIERRWKAEQLKPDFDITYNLLGNGWGFNNNPSDGNIYNILSNNYKLGIQFEMPLFLRKERGALRLADIKLSETDWQLQLKRQSLQAKMEVYIASLAALERQLILGTSVVDQYRQLFEAEQIKFEAGGSSIFYLNVRQQKLLESKMKLLKLQTERHKMLASLIWSTGTGYR